MDVPAHSPRIQRAAYRISYGVEYGESREPQLLYKVQLVEDGVVVNSADLSFPDDEDDAVRLARAITEFATRPHVL